MSPGLAEPGTGAGRVPRAGARDRLLLLAVLGWGWLAMGTELLGSVGRLQRGPVLAWWALGLAIALVPWRRGPRASMPALPRQWRAEWGLAAALALLLGWSLAQALLSPPNNLDSLQYHLPRQVHWAQAGRVDHFPTSDLRQLTMPPLAEYAGLHLLLASGGDHWHNLVQWGALLLAAVAASLIAREIGGGGLAQLLATTLVVSTPPALAQASNTKNDVVVAFWLATAALWALRLARSARPWPSAGWMPVLLGLCFGGLALTKGTGIVVGLPVALLAAFGLRRWRPLAVLTVVLVAAALNAPHVVRNWRWFGSPYGPESAAHGERVTSELHTAGALASTVARNLARQVVLPLSSWNGALQGGVAELHAALALSPDDPRTTYRRPPWARLTYSGGSEDAVTAPVQTLLLLGLPLLLATRRGSGDRRGVLVVWALAAAGFLLFSAAFKWQLWHGRLLVPLFVLGAPAAAVACAARRPIALLVAVAALVGALPTLQILQRPLLGERSILRQDRAALYFHGVPGLGQPGRQTLELVSRLEPRVVALAPDSYAFMGGLWATSPGRPRFTPFNARWNPRGEAEPRADVLVSQSSPPQRVRHDSSGEVYVPMVQVGPFTLSVPEGAVDEARRRLQGAVAEGARGR